MLERESKVKYTQYTLHTQLPAQFQQVWELYRILRMQLGQQQSKSDALSEMLVGFPRKETPHTKSSGRLKMNQTTRI